MVSGLGFGVSRKRAMRVMRGSVGVKEVQKSKQMPVVGASAELGLIFFQVLALCFSFGFIEAAVVSPTASRNGYALLGFRVQGLGLRA